jgi:hypothetical protein
MNDKFICMEDSETLTVINVSTVKQIYKVNTVINVVYKHPTPEGGRETERFTYKSEKEASDIHRRLVFKLLGM